jgi:Fe-S cluster biogenesis protein NfuA
VNISVTLEFTPNPDTLKYVVSTQLLERGALDFTDASKAEGAPLAQRLFRTKGVKAVMIAKDFVTVTVEGQDVMMDVNTAMLREIREHLEAGEPVVTDALPAQDEHGTDDSLVAQQIKSILDQQVRPAVAMDGGDIVFDRFENGIVYLELKGSCAGCPSSTATLKMGIEQHLREMIPEVQQVEAV